MAFATTVLMLIAASFHVDGETLTGYIPRITPRGLEGKIATSTFVLEQPRCNFTDVGEDDKIWLLVARSSVYEGINLLEIPQNISYQEFSKNSYYKTLGTSALSYPCATSPDEITVLRVGNETSCINTSKPDCNGPLPDAGPYRVRFIAIRPNGTMFQSKWSEEIKLIQGRNYSTINTQPRRRSKEMIAITSVLSILCAILLASFIAALIYKYSDICDKADIMSVRDTATVTRYTTHHMYDQPTSKS